jgi:hypothetical protein
LVIAFNAVEANNDETLGRVIGIAWFDINRNNRRDPGEPLLPGVDVQLIPRGVTGQSASNIHGQVVGFGWIHCSRFATRKIFSEGNQ